MAKKIIIPDPIELTICDTEGCESDLGVEEFEGKELCVGCRRDIIRKRKEIADRKEEDDRWMTLLEELLEIDERYHLANDEFPSRGIVIDGEFKGIYANIIPDVIFPKESWRHSKKVIRVRTNKTSVRSNLKKGWGEVKAKTLHSHCMKHLENLEAEKKREIKVAENRNSMKNNVSADFPKSKPSPTYFPRHNGGGTFSSSTMDFRVDEEDYSSHELRCLGENLYQFKNLKGKFTADQMKSIMDLADQFTAENAEKN